MEKTHRSYHSNCVGDPLQYIINTVETYSLQERRRFHVVVVNDAQLSVVVNNIGATQEIAKMRWRH